MVAWAVNFNVMARKLGRPRNFYNREDLVRRGIDRMVRESVNEVDVVLQNINFSGFGCGLGGRAAAAAAGSGGAIALPAAATGGFVFAAAFAAGGIVMAAAGTTTRAGGGITSAANVGGGTASAAAPTATAGGGFAFAAGGIAATAA